MATATVLSSFSHIVAPPEAGDTRRPAKPARTLTRTYAAVPQDDSSIELQQLPSQDGQVAEHDLEMSRPSTPSLEQLEGVVEMQQTLTFPHMNMYRFLCACLFNLGNGLSDSAAGPLLPYIEQHYSIGYAIVSLIFIGQAIGFITGAFVIDALRERLGRGKVLALSGTLMAIGYVIISVAAAFPLLVLAYALIGLGMTLNLGMSNIFCGALQQSTTALGIMHGAYGVGGTVGPLIATSIVAAAHKTWNTYYFLVLALALVNGGLGFWSYWGFENEAQQNEALITAPAAGGEALHTRRTALTQLKEMLSTLRSKVVLLGALFIFAYQGAEVSIAGWIISFLQTSRSTDSNNTASLGYVSAGFWAGVTIGRFVLSAPAQRIGEKKFVYFLTIWAAIFELLVWQIPNVIGDAVAVAIVGLFLGPVYPCAVSVMMRTMTRRERLSGMGVVSAFGASGGAVAPFMTGLLAQAVGTFVLHPIAISLFVAMLGCWVLLPDARRRTE